MPDGIDVLLVTFNSAATVAAALGAALASPRVTAAVVVDNASGDGSVEAAAQAGATVVLRNPVNVGFAAAVNRGLRECHGEYVLLLNPDATLEPSALELLAAALDETPAAVMAGPVLVAGDGRLDTGARRFSTCLNRLAWHLPLPRRPQWATPEYLNGIGTTAVAAAECATGGETPLLATALSVDYLWGAALLVRRRFLNDIGGLDERFFLYSEDEDLGRQARARGALSLLVPRARAGHVGGASTPDAAFAQARVIAANGLLLEKWEDRGAALLYRRGIGPVLGVRAAALRAAGRYAEADLAARTRQALRYPGGLDVPSGDDGPGHALRLAPLSGEGAAGQAVGYAVGTCRLAARAVIKASRTYRDRASEEEPAVGEAPAAAEPADGPAAADGPAGEPLVSVILPVYNAAGSYQAYLRPALESVTAQGGAAPLELIVVDDGSTDDTSELVAEFLQAHPRLPARLVYQPNAGQSSARNHGAAMSRAPWLAFLDQDDEWTGDHLRAVLPQLTEDVDLVYTDADTIDGSGRVKDVGIHRNLGLGGGHPKASVADAVFQDVFVMPGVTTIRRKFFEALGGFDERLSGYEDDDLFLRCLECGRLRYLPVSTLRWRIHDESASHSDRMIVSGLRYWEKLVARYAKGEQASALDRRLALRFLRVFLSYASLQLLADDPLLERNLAAAESLLPHVGAVDRAAFAATHWAWRRKTFAARCARSWFLNGLQTATGEKRPDGW